MPKTVFSPGVVVSSTWLNGSQNIQFDGLTEEDWHYPKLTIDSLNLEFISGSFVNTTTLQEISGEKIFTIVPKSSGSAVEPDDILTLKDISSEGRNFLQISCVEPLDGYALFYDQANGVWSCSAVIDGGSY